MRLLQCQLMPHPLPISHLPTHPWGGPYSHIKYIYCSRALQYSKGIIYWVRRQRKLTSPSIYDYVPMVEVRDHVDDSAHNYAAVAMMQVDVKPFQSTQCWHQPLHPPQHPSIHHWDHLMLPQMMSPGLHWHHTCFHTPMWHIGRTHPSVQYLATRTHW